jgi:hypothetical protein
MDVKQCGTTRYTRLTTDISDPHVTVDQVRAILDPLNWPLYGLPVYWRVEPLAPTADGWSRIVEEMGPLRLRTAFKYWKADVDGGAVVNYDIDDCRTDTDDDGVVLIDRGYISVVPHFGGVRLRTSKEFLIRGVNPTLAGIAAYAMGEIGQRCMLRTASHPPAGAAAWHVS